MHVVPNGLNGLEVDREKNETTMPGQPPPTMSDTRHRGEGLAPDMRRIDALVRGMPQLWMMAHEVIVRSTRKLLKRLSGPVASDADRSTAMFGDWYASVLPWRPRHVAFLVSETPLLPVMVPPAPASTLLERFAIQLAAVLRRHRVDQTVIPAECSGTVDYRVGATEPQRAGVNE